MSKKSSTFVPKLRECARTRTNARTQNIELRTGRRMTSINKNQFFMIDREYRNPI